MLRRATRSPSRVDEMSRHPIRQPGFRIQEQEEAEAEDRDAGQSQTPRFHRDSMKCAGYDAIARISLMRDRSFSVTLAPRSNAAVFSNSTTI